MTSLVHLQVEQRQKEGLTILDLKGKLILGPEDVLLRQRILALLDSGQFRLILNLCDLTSIDTAGLGTLAFCATKFREAGGRLVLEGLDESQTRLSDLFKLSATFELYPTELDAVNSFFPDRAVPHYDILAFVEEQEQKKSGER